MLIDDLKSHLKQFRAKLEEVRRAEAAHISWYPYDTLANIAHLDGAISGQYREMLKLPSGSSILDIGCADGELGFLLEELGYSVDFLDYSPTNFNRLEGLKALHSGLGSRGGIQEADIDAQFTLNVDYELVLCLGLLYHLKNPFYFLETLARRCRYCLLSTRVFQVTKDPIHRLHDVPVAYLLAPRETNNDSTNFWIFSDAGLRRLFQRAGWNILSFHSVGELKDSDPSSADRDERVFCLLRSTSRL